MKRSRLAHLFLLLGTLLFLRGKVHADTVPLDLFRWGNSSSPKLDNVRPTDLGTFKRNGEDWVEARSGGVSLFSTDAGRPNTWKLPKNTAVPVKLDIYDDGANSANHWLIRPAVDMKMTEYVELLRQFSARLTKVR